MWFKIITGNEYKQYKADKAQMILDRNTIAEYKCKIADLECSLAKAKEQSAEYKCKIADLECSLAKAKEQSAEYKCKIDDLERSLALAKEQSAEYKCKIDDLERSLALAKEQSAEYKCKIDDLERSLALAKEQSAKLLQQKSHVEKIKLEVELDTRKAQKKILELSKQLRRVEAEFARATNPKVKK